MDFRLKYQLHLNIMKLVNLLYLCKVVTWLFNFISIILFDVIYYNIPYFFTLNNLVPLRLFPLGFNYYMSILSGRVKVILLDLMGLLGFIYKGLYTRHFIR